MTLDDGFGPDDVHPEIQALLRAAPMVEARPGALERIIAQVAIAEVVNTHASTAPELADVITFTPRRRQVPRLAAAAAALVIIASVVGGVGGDTTIPAVGELINRHSAAASVPSSSSPDDRAATAMPLDAAGAMAPEMPASMTMTEALHHHDEVIQLVYRDDSGGVMSIFRQEGDTDVHDVAGYMAAEMAAEMHGAGSMDMMGETPVWFADVAGNHIVVLDGDGFVWTVIADHHDDAMMVTMSDTMPVRDASLLERTQDRVRDMADALVDPWRF